MMGNQSGVQASLCYAFNLEDHVPQDHLLRSIDRFIDLADIRCHLFRKLFEDVLRRTIAEGLVGGDTGYGSAEMLGWLVYEHGIEPHIPVFDKSGRRDGTFSRSDFIYDPDGDVYYCPGGKSLHQYRRPFKKERDAIDGDGMRRYRASKHDCEACVLKRV